MGIQNKPLYILDLEGTTGIYSKSNNHVNDTIQLRSGFSSLLLRANMGELRIAIASRAPRHFVDEIIANLQRRGLTLDCKTYAQEDLELPDKRMISYKDYKKVYEDHGITDPEAQTIVVGDFLRFRRVCLGDRGFSPDEYRSFDFTKQPSVLSSNYALNDHPLPVNGKTPVYAVVPQPWTTFQERERVTLDMAYVIDFLQTLYSLGQDNFKQGFNLTNRRLIDNQYVKFDGLACKILGQNHVQDYLILKGRKENWKPMAKIM